MCMIVCLASVHACVCIFCAHTLGAQRQMRMLVFLLNYITSFKFTIVQFFPPNFSFPTLECVSN